MSSGAVNVSHQQLNAVQYTVAARHTATATTSSGGRRRSAARAGPSRCDPDDFSEAPKTAPRPACRQLAWPSTYEPEESSEAPAKVITSVLAKPTRSTVKKHVQFPDEQSCIEEAPEIAEITEPEEQEKPIARVISSLWMELESEAPAPER